MKVLLLVVGIAFVGCFDDHATTREPVCIPREGDDAMFATLTAQRWGACGSSVGLCLELSASGRFVADRGEGDYRITSEGRWNFLARDIESGLVCLEDGSVIDFALTPAGLVWGLTGLLPPRDPLVASGTRGSLREVLPVAELFELTANAWTKTNELDLHMHPTSMMLRRDGTFAASYRDGDCETTGTFSLVSTATGVELNPRALPNACDSRGGGTPASLGASNERPRIERDVLRLYGASYRDSDLVTEVRSLTFSAYGDAAGVRVEARWNGPLVADMPVPWTFAIHNDSERSQTVTSLKVTVTPIVEIDNGFSTSGPATVVLERAVRETVAPGRVVEHSDEVGLSGSGLVMIEIDVSSYDDVQRYDNQRHFISTL